MKNVVAVGVALAVLAAAGSSVGADLSLVGQWHLDEGSGSTIADSSGNGNNGTVLNGGARWVPGRFGTALSFDGTTGWVEVKRNPSLEPASAVSVSAWVKSASSPGDYKYIVAKGATGCIAASYGLYSGPSGGLEFYVSENRGTTYVRSPDAGSGVWDGNWHMVVGTFDGAHVRLFLDCTEVGTGTARTGQLEYLLPDSNDLYVGDYPGCQLHAFAGAIDELNIWSRALGPADVQAAISPPSQGSPGTGGPGTGGPTMTPAGPTGTPAVGTGGAGNNKGTSPAVRGLTVSPSAFALTSNRGGHSIARSGNALITYIDTQAARSSFTVLARRSGIRVRGKCIKSSRHKGRKHVAGCFYYTRVGSFTHVDTAGRNRIRFAALRGLRLAAGTYRLEVTPSANGLAGTTISVLFTILR